MKQRQLKSQQRRKRKAEIVSVSVLSKVLSLDQSSCQQIWNIEQEKDREKVDRQKKSSEAQRRKRAKYTVKLEREIRSHLLLEERPENFVAAVTK